MAFACQGRSDRLRVHCKDAARLGGGYNASVRKASPPFEIQPKSNTYLDWIAPNLPPVTSFGRSISNSSLLNSEP